jgi:hypothetical protein
MNPKFFASAAGRATLLAVTGAIAFILSTLILRHGLKAWPDSWYDWQGSINLIEHGTYTTMLGVAIHDWPPLYSVYLALFQIIFGQTGWTLMLSTAVLAALNAVVWGAYTFKVFPDGEKAPPTLVILASLAFLALYLPLYFISVLPNGLLLLFVGLILHLLAAMAEDATPWGGVKKSILVGLLLGAGVFTHNSTIVYIAASIIVIFITMPTPLRQRLAAIGMILLISGTAWMLVPHGLSLKSQHTPAIVSATGMATPSKVEQGTHFLFDPKFSFGQYLVQFPEGVGVFFLSMTSVAAQAVVGWVIFVTALFLLCRKPESLVESRQRLFLGFGLLGMLGHFAIFNLIWLDTVFGDRFAWYFAMICVPIFFSRFRRHTLVVAVMLVMVLGVSGWRTFKLLRTGAVPVLVAPSNEVSLNYIHPEYFLTSRPNPAAPAGAIAIEPPIYRWQLTMNGEPPSGVHETVILIRKEPNPP